MATRYVKFAPERLTEAEALCTFLNTHLATVSPALVTWEMRMEGGSLPLDTNDNWVVAWPYDGPFLFGGNIIPQPSGMETVLEYAVIVDTPDFKPLEE